MMSVVDHQIPARPSRRPVTVVLADDECMFRSSLRHLLMAPPSVIKDVYGADVGPGFEVVGEAGSGEETISVVKTARPDLLLLDLSMPRMSGLEAFCELHGQCESMRTILLAGTIDRPHLLTAVQRGIRGLVMKDSTTELLFEAIIAVMSGRFWLGQALVSDLVELVRSLSHPSGAVVAKPRLSLTPREREVLTLVVAGHTNREIATQFSVSEETVKHHLTRMFDKVGASNRLELAIKATQTGLAGTSEPDSLR
jgi:two-component system, NarL family, nitrate/nitrite response regulator NarL